MLLKRKLLGMYEKFKLVLSNESGVLQCAWEHAYKLTEVCILINPYLNLNNIFYAMFIQHAQKLQLLRTR